MMDWNENSPETITEAILKYLEAQEVTTNDEEGVKGQQSGLLYVRSFLDQIITNITNRAELIEEFQAKLKAHNQFLLFDLSSVIPDFFIDDDMYDKLTFREKLMVSCLNHDGNSYIPKIVGGLCLDIQKAKGKNPIYRKDIGLEQRLIEFITTKLNANRTLCGSENLSPKTLHDSAEKILVETQSNPELEDFIKFIKPQYERTNCKFLVHVSSQFDVEGHMGGSRITAWVDRNFHTLEEKRTEFYKESDTINEKTLYCALQPRRYFIKHTSSYEKLEEKKYYSMGKTQHLIGEGANFILMRYLAITRYIGSFELSAIYINGDMCRNVYECFGPESGLVNEQKLDLCKIYRTIIEECGITHRCITILTLQGQIVKQEWIDCDYILQINPLAYIDNKKPAGNEHLLLEKVWETDMQLFSKFLDSKTTCAMKIKSYLDDHPEFKNMMADYVKTTLLMKPDDILEFTVNHFMQYYPQCMQNSGCWNE